MIKNKLKHIEIILISIFILASNLSVLAEDGVVSMNVEASNTTDEKLEKFQIRQNLPREIKKEDVVDAGGMDIRYDEEQTVYYLYAEADLNPQENKIFKVAIRDIWAIPDTTFTFLKEQVDQRLESLKEKEAYGSGKVLRDALVAKIDSIQVQQGTQGGDIQKRIDLHRTHTQQLNEIRKKVTVLEDFTREALHHSDVQKENKTMRFVIEAKNPSEVEAQEKVDVIKYLPEGFGPDQVLDAQGFEVQFDPEKNLYYLKNIMDFQPLESKKFEVLIADIWFISESRLTELQATDSLTLKLAGTGYEKLGAYLTLEIKKYADEIKDTQQKAVTPEDKVAAYAANLKRIEGIEKNIEQLRRLVEAAEKAKAKKLSEVIKTVTPDVATTWKIIYATIAFLAIISLFFYFLWWGQAKAKQNQKIEVLQPPTNKEK